MSDDILVTASERQRIADALSRLATERDDALADARQSILRATYAHSQAVGVWALCDWFARLSVRPARVPSDVLRAIDRMCTPLDDSWLGSKTATAQEDARCMRAIRDYVLGTAVKDSLTTAVTRVPFSMPDAAVERICDAAGRAYRRFKSSVRGQIVTQADGYEWHVINATLDEVRAMLDRQQPAGGVL